MQQLPVTMRLLAACTRLWNGLNRVSGTTTTAAVEPTPAELMQAALEIQTSAIFHCPEELFSEILSHFPLLRWADLHYLSLVPWRESEVPDIYGGRVHVLLALSATCRAMRLKFLPGVWENIIAMRFRTWRRPDRVPLRLRSQCRILTGDPSIASHVRVMTVSLSCGGTDKAIKDFARCLPALPNLRTLEISSIEHPQLLCAGLKSTTLPQIRTVILPSAAHHILRHCPNIEDLTCSPDGPGKEFFGSLAAGKLNLRRFATLRPGEVDSWTGLAKICPQIKELSFTHRVHTLQDSKKCITALKSISTIRLVNYIQAPMLCVCYLGSSQDPFEEEARTVREFVKGSEDAWEEVKKVAREHLKGCGSSGPKTLRTVALAYNERTGVEYLEPEEEFSI